MTTRTKAISNSDDIIDSRDIIARIEELESEVEDCETCKAHAADSEADACDDTEHTEELPALKSFSDEMSGYCPDWTYGEGLIRDSYFEEYAQQMAEDIGAIDPKASWPLNFIDWKAAAEALQGDYTSAEFDGVTYWGR